MKFQDILRTGIAHLERGHYFFSRSAVSIFAILVLAAVDLRAQNTTYTNGEINPSSIDTTGNITLTITSGAATQSGPITGNGMVTFNPLSSDVGTLTISGTDSSAGDTFVDFGTLGVSGTGATITHAGNTNVGYHIGDSGTLLIFNGGTVSDSYGSIGFNSSSMGSVTVDGTGSTWNNGSGYLVVGNYGTGTLTISNGGTVSNSTGSIGLNSGGTGSVMVTGTGSTWNNGIPMYVGDGGTGTLTISNGGTVLDGDGYIGYSSGSTGSVTVDGTGSTWNNNSFYLYVGAGGTGRLNISNGGTVLDGRGYIGGNPGSTGSVTVDGTGSIWTNSIDLYVSNYGTGTLTIANGGTVSSPVVELADWGGSQGTVDINSGGVLATGQVVAGSGTAAINFNGGTLRATASSGDFISNFTGTEVQLLSGGGTIDNGGYNITVSSPITGTGSLTSNGTGTLLINGSNTYTGQTTITGGTLAIGAGGSIANSSSVSLTASGGTFDISASTTPQSVNDLNGVVGSTLNLGGKSLTVNTDTNEAFSGLIQGSGGSLIKGGSSVLILTNANTYSGGTTINAGTLSISSDNNLGDASGSLTFNGGTLETTASFLSLRNLTLGATGGTILADAGVTTTWGGLITGPGSLTKTGAGTLVLSHFNNYQGGTTIAAGTLQDDIDMGMGTGSVSILTGATLEVSTNIQTNINGLNGQSGSLLKLDMGSSLTVNVASGTDIFSGNITSVPGIEVLDKRGAGTLILDGNNDINGVVVAGEGELDLNSSTALSKNGFLQIAAGAKAVINGVDVTVAGLSTRGTDGDLVLNGGGITLASTIAVPSLLFTGVISGTGNLTMNSASSVQTLSGSNTYSGATIISAGTLAIGAGGSIANSSSVSLASSGGTFDISASTTPQSVNDLNGVVGSTLNLGGKSLTVNTDANEAFSGLIQGSGGSLIKGGSSALILTNANTYSGGTTINAGTLAVGNSAALGSGNVAVNGGTLSTDNVNHLVTVNGDYTQGAGGTLLLNLVSPTVYDKMILTSGTAHLNGTLKLNLVGSFAPGGGQSYTLIATNNPIDGTFSTVTTNLPSLSGTIDYTNNVTVLYQNSFVNLPGINLNPNQKSVATYIDTFDKHITNPSFAALVGALNNASGNPQTMANSLSQLTPVNFGNFVSSTAFNNAAFGFQQLDGYLSNHRGADGTFVSSNGGIDYSGLAVNDPSVDTSLQSVHSRLLAWSPAPSTGLLSDSASLVTGGMDMKDVTDSMSGPTNLWNVFINGSVILGQDFSNSSAGIPYASSTTGAAQIGADYKITKHFLVGATFGYGHTNTNLDSIGSNAKVDTYSPGVYASYTSNGWFANVLGSYGFGSYSQTRNVQIPGFSGSAHSSPGGHQIVGNLDGGYEFHKGNWTFGPTLGLGYTHLNVDGYTETGLPGADLTVGSQQADSLRSRFGGAVSYAVKSGSLLFTPHFSASWQHEFMDQSRGITSQFSDVGAGSFLVATANPSRDSRAG